MSKKKKIIISSIVAFVLLAGIVTTLVLVFVKRFSNYTDAKIDYNTHTEMACTDYGTTYKEHSAVTYSNGTQIIKNNSNEFGIYSWREGKAIVAPAYSNIYVADEGEEGGKTYFRLVDNQNISKITLVDENGEYLDELKFDAEKKSTYTQIKTKSVSVESQKNGSVKTKSGDDKKENVYIKSYTLGGEIIGENYHYELWELTTIDDRVYTNIFDLFDGRELVQTIGANDGLDFDTNNLSIYVLENGDIRFLETNPQVVDSNTKTVTLSVYDKNYNLKKESSLGASVIQNLVCEPIRVGDNLLIQCKKETTEDDYNLCTSSSGVTTYYTYQTYKLNLKNGSIKEINFKYLLNKDILSHTTLNANTSVIDVTKIKDKKADHSTYLLINNRFQTKEIEYGIENLIKVSEKRFVAKSHSGDYNLIDNKFGLVCNLGSIDSYFTTSESIIVTKGDVSYVCNLDGLTLKSYDASEIINIKDEKYYMIKVLSQEEGKVKTEYYLERLSKRNSTPIYSHIEGESEYYSDGVKYDGLDISNLDSTNRNSFTLVTKITKVGSYNYTYEICTISGDVLLSRSGLSDIAYKPALVHSSMIGDDYVVVAFSGSRYTLDR